MQYTVITESGNFLTEEAKILSNATLNGKEIPREALSVKVTIGPYHQNSRAMTFGFPELTESGKIKIAKAAGAAETAKLLYSYMPIQYHTRAHMIINAIVDLNDADVSKSV